MADEKLISQITLPSGSTYDIKDTWARTKIQALSKSTQWLGITTTEGIADGVSWLASGSIKPISINGESVTPDNGSIVQTHYTDQGSREYILTVTRTGETITSATWQEFGDLSSLGTLAYKDSAAGQVAVPTSATFTGTQATINSSGTVSVPTSATFTGNYVKLTGTTVVPSTYTSSSSPTTTATNATITEVTSGNNLEAKGTVGTPTISLATAGTTTTIKNPTSKTVVTSVGVSDPAAADASGEKKYYEMSGETLILKKLTAGTGASITTANVTVKTGDGAYSSSQPTFTGQKYLVKYDKTTGVTTTTTTNATANADLSISAAAGTAQNYTLQPSGSVALTNGSKTVDSSATYTPAGSIELTTTNKNVTVS